ncbi:MAG: GxxExxY protein, partial [Candidatus Spyradosoma sp.]
QKLSGAEESQVLNYLKATRLPLCLLVNFGEPRARIKRFINTASR